MLEYQSNMFLIDPREKFVLRGGQAGRIYFFQLAKFRQWLNSPFFNSQGVSIYLPIASRKQLDIVRLESRFLLESQIHFVERPFEDWLDIIKTVQGDRIQLSRGTTELGKASPQQKIHPQANVHPSAIIEGEVHRGALIGPQCYIGPHSVVGEDTCLASGVHVYSKVRIGLGCQIESGVVLGSHGFGFGSDDQLIPHLSGVEIANEVFIGANSVIAAGCLQPTRIGSQVALDSFVQIGHHAQIGDGVKMASQSGIGGSTHVGDHTLIAGGAQISDGLMIGSHVKVAAKAGVIEDVPSHSTIGGFPSMTITRWHRLNQIFKKLLP